MDASRRHKRPGLETKDFIIFGTESMLCLFPPYPIVPLGRELSFAKGPDEYRIGSELYYRRGTLSLGNILL